GTNVKRSCCCCWLAVRESNNATTRRDPLRHETTPKQTSNQRLIFRISSHRAGVVVRGQAHLPPRSPTPHRTFRKQRALHAEREREDNHETADGMTHAPLWLPPS
ncbi:unnamed protein product, partial [Ectocarpus fasciculatus]